MDALFSTTVRGGKITYFIDVRETANGTKYLSISESKRDGDNWTRTSLTVFGDNVARFREAIDEAAGRCSAG